MTTTPETNAAEDRCIRTGFKLGYVDVEFAADLERQLRKARDTVHRLRTQRGIARNFAAQMERERNESLYDATQETLKVSTLKSHWIAVCQERDQLAQALKAILFFCEEDQQFASKPYRAAFLHAQKLVTRHPSPATPE